MLRLLRRQAQEMLDLAEVRRKPALRRPDDPDALLATDLPLACEEAEAQAFIRRMTERGWQVREKAGWLLLDAPVPAPEANVPCCLSGEIGCCISLLVRHQNDVPDVLSVRALVKAEDAGQSQVDRLCAQWHREWAGALRRGDMLPGGLLPYLCHAAGRYTKEDAE